MARNSGRVWNLDFVVGSVTGLGIGNSRVQIPVPIWVLFPVTWRPSPGPTKPFASYVPECFPRG